MPLTKPGASEMNNPSRDNSSEPEPPLCSAFGRWHAAAAAVHNWLFCQPRVLTTFAGSF
jgi:hypothetical protein